MFEHNCSSKGLSQSYAWKQALALLKPYNTASSDFCVNPTIQLTFGNVTNLFTILIHIILYQQQTLPNMLTNKGYCWIHLISLVPVLWSSFMI